MTTPAHNPITPYRPGQTLSADALRRALHRLHAAATATDSPGHAGALYLPADDFPNALAHLPRHPHGAGWLESLQNAGGSLLRGDHGLAVFRAGPVGLALVPPFPLNASGIYPDINTRPLTALLSQDYTIGVALLRLGRYAIAVYQGQRLLVSKTDTRYVKSRHRAGGTSQQRFRRVRENQIHRLYTAAAAILESQWRPYAASLDYVALGGEDATLNGFIRESPLLQHLAPRTIPYRLAVRQPNRASLDLVAPMLYQCRAYPLQWTP